MQSNATEHAALADTALHIEHVVKRYGDREVLYGIDLDVTSGEFVVIVGRSGCNKSTLLRLIVGLEGIDDGHLRHDGEAEDGLHDDARAMFQDARLLPWEKVLDSVALGLPKTQRARAAEVLAQVGPAERAGEWPARLSGGQHQRVTLTCALVHRPRLLLLDEPLGALDALTRTDMQNLIEGLQQRLGFIAVLVTHDVAEAVALADRVVLIRDGRVAPDERVDLPRPRRRGSPAFARLEETILNRMMQRKSDPDELTDVCSHTAWASPFDVSAISVRWVV